MKKETSKPKRHKPRNDTCVYCGEKEFERTAIKHVGVIRICKNCGEQAD
jgi:transcription elongation factor Elf1